MIKVIDNMGFVKEVTPTVFPDTTKLLKVDIEVGPGDYTIIWLYDNDEELFQVIAITKHLQAKGFEVNLRMPYIPNARMDQERKRGIHPQVFRPGHQLAWIQECLCCQSTLNS